MTQDPHIEPLMPAEDPTPHVPDPEPPHEDTQPWDAERAAREGVPGDVDEPEHDPATTDPSQDPEQDTEAPREQPQ